MAISSGKNMPVVTDEILEKAMQKHIAGKGRPTKFTPALAAEICDRTAAGQTLKKICMDEHIPDYSTIGDWRRNLPHFAAMFARARLNQGDALADDAIDILDSTTTAKTLTEIRSAEVRAKGRLELAKCRDRDQYGDKQRIDQHIQIEHTVGGIIDLVMGKTIPLVCIEAEEIPLISE